MADAAASVGASLSGVVQQMSFQVPNFLGAAGYKNPSTLGETLISSPAGPAWDSHLSDAIYLCTERI